MVDWSALTFSEDVFIEKRDKPRLLGTYMEAGHHQSAVPWEPAPFATGPLKNQWAKYWPLVRAAYLPIIITHSTDDMMTSLIAFLSWWATLEHEHANNKRKRTTKMEDLPSHATLEEFLAFLNNDAAVSAPPE
jgi:hypothetical protein